MNKLAILRQQRAEVQKCYREMDPREDWEFREEAITFLKENRREIKAITQKRTAIILPWVILMVGYIFSMLYRSFF